MNSRLALITVLTVALLGAYVHGRQGGPQASKLDVVKVKDDLFVIHNVAVPGNTTALITNEGVILVDDKFDIDHANILASVKTITNLPVKYVINTHHHGDHTGGNAKLQAIGAVAVSTEAARQHMVDGRQPGLPTIAFNTQTSITLAGKRVELYYFGRAHTSGDLVAYFPAQRTLAAGDMFTFGDATPQLIDYAGGGSAKEWPRTIDRVLALDFDTVVPGHGIVTTKAELAKFRDQAESLRAKTREMIVKKLPRDEIRKMLVSDFRWAELHLGRGFDGLLAELQ
jgi:cyclase